MLQVNYVPLPPRNAHLTEKKPERPLQPKPRLPGYESPSLPTATRADPPYMTVPGPSGYQRYSDELPDEEEDEIFTMVYFEGPDGDCQDGNASVEGSFFSMRLFGINMHARHVPELQPGNSRLSNNRFRQKLPQFNSGYCSCNNMANSKQMYLQHGHLDYCC